MTTETTETTEDTASEEIPETESTQTETTEEAPAGSNREARYRRQLRDTEAERDTLATQLDAMRRSEAERIAGTVVAEPAALWAADVQLGDLLGEDGTVDPDKVTAAAQVARDQLGLQPRPRGNRVPREGQNAAPAGQSTSFESAFAPN